MKYAWLLSLFLISSIYGAIDSKVDRKPIHEAYITPSSSNVPVEMILGKPPVDKIEKPPLSPYEGMQWIAGYWIWDREYEKFEWVCGVWRFAPPGLQWVPGYWKQGTGWYRVPGLWHPSSSQAIIAPVMPPDNPEENTGIAPNNNAFWAKGYWEYNPFEQNYRWLSGSWQAFDPAWVFIPATWSWRNEGYLFTPSYWDYKFEDRGVLFDCSNGKYQPISTEVAISRLFYDFPAYTSFFAHHFHFHPEFWKDCWCLPPWWKWSSWWSLNDRYQWSLWWWWSHPDFPSPGWVSPGMASNLPPPQPQMVDYFKGAKAPIFMTPRGSPSRNEWYAVIKKVTGKNTPLLSVKLLTQAQEEAATMIGNAGNLKPTGQGSPEQMPKPLFRQYAAPVAVSVIPTKPMAIVPIIKENKKKMPHSTWIQEGPSVAPAPKETPKDIYPGQMPEPAQPEPASTPEPAAQEPTLLDQIPKG